MGTTQEDLLRRIRERRTLARISERRSQAGAAPAPDVATPAPVGGGGRGAGPGRGGRGGGPGIRTDAPARAPERDEPGVLSRAARGARGVARIPGAIFGAITEDRPEGEGGVDRPFRQEDELTLGDRIVLDVGEGIMESPRAIGRGLSEVGHRTGIGVAELVGADRTAANFRASRELGREVFGESETVTGNVVGAASQLVGEGALFLAPGAAAGKGAQALQATGRSSRFLNLLANPATRLQRAAQNFLTGAPIDLAISQAGAEESLAGALEMLTGDEELGAIAQDRVSRGVFDVLTGFGLGEIIGEGAHAIGRARAGRGADELGRVAAKADAAGELTDDMAGAIEALPPELQTRAKEAFAAEQDRIAREGAEDVSPEDAARREGLPEEVVQEGAPGSERRGGARRRLADIVDPERARETADLETQLQAQRRATEESFVDEKTGLANQNAFERAKSRLEADPEGELVIVDVRNQKAMNDLSGSFAMADTRLRQIADQLRALEDVPNRDIFRSGGDEFAFRAPKGEGAAIGRRLQEAIGTERILDSEFEFGIRFGVGDNVEAAEQAVAAAKKLETGARFRDVVGEAGGAREAPRIEPGSRARVTESSSDPDFDQIFKGDEVDVLSVDDITGMAEVRVRHATGGGSDVFEIPQSVLEPIESGVPRETPSIGAEGEVVDQVSGARAGLPEDLRGDINLQGEQVAFDRAIRNPGTQVRLPDGTVGETVDVPFTAQGPEAVPGVPVESRFVKVRDASGAERNVPVNDLELVEDIAGETIQSAAIRTPDGQQFEGVIHGEAHQKAVAAGALRGLDDFESGFTTSTGRFVSREEAARIAGVDKPQLAAEDANLPGPREAVESPETPGAAPEGQGVADPGQRVQRVRELQQEPPEARVPWRERDIGIRVVGDRQDTVFPGQGEKVVTEYAVVEASSVRASHTPDFTQRTPEEFPSEIQGRAYHGPRGRAAREETERLITQFDPDRAFDRTVTAAEGPPTITERGINVAGNGRTIAQQRMWQQDPARAERLLKDELIARADQFSIDPEAVRGMDQPMLVRNIVDEAVDDLDVGQLRRLNQSSDTPSGKAKDAVSDAASRAEQLKGAEGALRHFADTIPEDATVRSYLGTKDGVTFLRKLVDDGVISSAERARFIDANTGAATAEGKNLVEQMLFAAAVGDADVLARAPEGVLRKLDTSLPALIRSDQHPEWRIGPVVREGLDVLASARAQGMKLEDMLAQIDITRPAPPPRVAAMARFLENTPKKGIRDAFRSYADDAEAFTRQSASEDLFGHQPRGPEEAGQEFAALNPGRAEIINAAAVQEPGGRIFQGRTHLDAVNAATDAGIDEALLEESIDGFMTSRGRFVDRLEARELAEAAEQLDDVELPEGGAFFGLDAQDLPAHVRGDVVGGEVTPAGVPRTDTRLKTPDESATEHFGIRAPDATRQEFSRSRGQGATAHPLTHDLFGDPVAPVTRQADVFGSGPQGITEALNDAQATVSRLQGIVDRGAATADEIRRFEQARQVIRSTQGKGLDAGELARAREAAGGAGAPRPADNLELALLKPQRLPESEIAAFGKSLQERHGLEELTLRRANDGSVNLEQITVPKDAQGQGSGTAAMRDILSWADENGEVLTLTLGERNAVLGTTSKERLRSFYSGLGFKSNRGRNKRFELSLFANMYRDPRPAPPAGRALDADSVPLAPKNQAGERLPAAGRFLDDTAIATVDVGPVQIIGDLSDAIGRALDGLGLKTASGRLPGGGRFKGALGVFKPRSQVIRLADAADVAVFGHEAGHAMHKLLFPATPPGTGALNKSALEGLPGAIRGELEDLAKGISDESLSEGWAEFWRRFLDNPSVLPTSAPNMLNLAELRLQEFPAVGAAWENARADWQTFRESSAQARLGSRISVGDRDAEVLSIADRWSRARTAIIDDFEPIRRVVQKIRDEVGIDSIAQEADSLARLTRGSVGVGMSFLETGALDFRSLRRVGPALKEVFAPISQNLDDFRKYLVARRAQELHGRDIMTGLRNQDVDAVVNQLNAKHGAKFRDAFDGVQEWNTNLLKYLRDSGVISKDSFRAIQELNQSYVPFYRVVEGEAAGSGLGGNFGHLFSPVKSIRGSGRDIVDPIESLVKNAMLYTQTAQKQQVSRALAELAQKEGVGPVLESIGTPIKPQTFAFGEIEGRLEQIVPGIDELLEDMRIQAAEDFAQATEGLDPAEIAAAGIELADPAQELLAIFRPGDLFSDRNMISVLENGKRKWFEVDDELFGALNALDREQLDTWARWMGVPARTLRAGATLAPEFLIRNPLRDQVMAFIQSEYGYVPFVDMAKGAFHLMRKGESYRQWMAAGGYRAALTSLDRASMQESMNALVAAGGVRNVIKSPMDALRAMSALMEDATRMGEFVNARAVEGTSKEGLQRAALASREISVDFARHGAKTAALRHLSAFWNARIQGYDRLFRSAKENPARFAAKAFTAITLPSLLEYYSNMDDPDYWEQPQWKRDLFWMIKVRGEFVSIPKPFELGLIFGTLPVRIIDSAIGGPGGGAELRGFLEESIIKGEVSGFLPQPTALMPLIENTVNYSFFLRRPIVPRSEQEVRDRFQSGPFTSEVANMLGRWSPGEDGLSPRKIDNLLFAWTGGLGRLGTEIADPFLEGRLPFTEGDVPPIGEGITELPGIRGVTDPQAGFGSESVERFYQEYERARIAHSTLRFLEQSTNEGAYQSELENAEFADLRDRLPAMRAAADELAQLRAEVEAIRRDPDMSSAEKRTEVDRLGLEARELAADEIGRFVPRGGG